jgi:hypothetical protein
LLLELVFQLGMLAWRKAFRLEQFDVFNLNDDFFEPAPDARYSRLMRLCLRIWGHELRWVDGDFAGFSVFKAYPKHIANILHSADATIASQATGAMSWAFVNALKKSPQQSYVQLLNSIRDELATRYTQKPQLSCSHPLDTNLLFVM